MKTKMRIPFVLLFILVILASSCREEKPALDDTATAMPAITPTPRAVETVPPVSLVANAAPAYPRVIGRYPAAGEEAGLDSVFEVYFDQPMRPDAVITVTDGNGAPVEGQTEWPESRVLRFSPAKPLQSDSQYQLTLDPETQAANGTPLLEGLTLDFYTIGELAVSQVVPNDGAQNVAIDSVITVIFNRPVVPLTVGEAASAWPNPLNIEPEIPGQGEWVNTSVYVYRPESTLIGSQSYQVTVLADVINSLSATGATMAEDMVSLFTVTPPTFNFLELVDGPWNPRTGYDNMRLDQSFRLHFNQPMESESTEAAVSLRSGSTHAPFISAWSEDFVTLTITPTQLLTLDTTYILRIDESATSSQGGTMASAFSWSAATVEYPAIRKTTPADGRTESDYSSFFRIEFTSPMAEESLKGRVIITPDIIGDPDGLYSPWNWSQNYYGFRPSTTYTVQILPGMKDVYGNEITEGRTITFTTGKLQPSASLNLPYSVALYRSSGSDSLWVSHQNVSELELALYSLPLQTFGRLLHGDLYDLRFNPPSDSLVWQNNVPVTAPLNEMAHKRFVLNQENTGPLPTGFYFVALDSPEIRHNEPHAQAQVLVMATANAVLKTTATEAMIWATDLTTGNPLPDVPVYLYDRTYSLVVEGVTDEFGLAYFDGLSLETGWDARYFAVVGEPGDDIFGVAISNWNEGISSYDFGIYTDFYLQPNQPTGYIYTERPVYRPGQPVYFKGVIRLNDDLSYSLPAFAEVQVQINSYDETVYTDTLSLSDFGSFSGEFLLDDEAALGNYWIGVTTTGGDRIGNGYFEVAEFRKPTFQVQVTAEERDVSVGDTIQLAVDARFFSGGVVVDGAVEWHVRSEAYTFSPGPSLGRYSFRSVERDLGYYYYDRTNQPTQVIAEGVGQTDGQGRLLLEIPAELQEGDGSRRFVIEVSVTDVAGNQVSGRSSVIVHRSLVYPGISATQSVATAGEPADIDVIVVDWTGDEVANQPVTVEVVERRWYSVQEEDDRGRTIWRSNVEEIPVEILGSPDLLTDENGRTAFQFIPPNGGVFRIYVSTQDVNGNVTRSSTYMWVSGEEYVAWRQASDHSFALISDKTSYEPGETAEILIASPFQGEVSALVTVERGHIKQHEVIQLVNNSTIYKLPITGDMAPNIFVSVMVIKGVDETNLAPDFKLGMTQFTVDREEQALSVTITPDRTAVSPGETVNFTVTVQDHNGQPVNAELSLSLTDLAVLTLANRKELPLLDHFYSERYLSVNTATLLAHNMDAYNQELEDEIKGGGGGAGSYGVLTIREEFPDTTYWEGQLETGPDGEVTVAVTLPDTLTTWRMDARAVTLDTKVGQTTVDIVSTLPVLISPQTPRFFIVGDEVQLGAVVHNNTETAVDATVLLDSSGVTLLEEAEQMITVPAGQQRFVTWTAVVQDVTRVDLIFITTAGAFSDATRPPLATLEGGGLPVYKYEVPETVGSSGQLLDGGAVLESIALPLYADYELTQGTVTIQVAPSLAAAMTDGLDYLEHYPYECTEQIVSKFLPNLLTVRALKAAGISEPALESSLNTQVNVALQRLYSRQNPDGGWGWWGTYKSNTLVTAYVIQALVEAQKSDFAVSQAVIDNGVTFLEGHIRNVEQLSGRNRYNRQAFLVYVLALAGAPSTQHMNTLFENRTSLDLYARGFLAQAIQLTDEEDPRLGTLLSDFISHANLSATGTSWEEAERDYWNWNTDTRTTAIVLDTMVKLDPDNPLTANAVRWLMAHRTDGRWASTQETAWTLMALTDFMVATGELQADFAYEVAVNGERQLQGEANATTLRDVQQLQLDINELLADELNQVAFGRTDGPGNLYYTTHLEAYLPVTQVQPLDRGIIISRSYFDPADRENPITEIEQGETFLARLTIVVPNTLHYVVIEDYLPAGAEAVDQSLQTSQQVGAPDRYTWEEVQERGWGWWVFNHVELRDEKVVLSADVLPAGTYEYVYLVRAAIPGQYQVIPPTAQEFYFPEVYGRGAGSLFAVLPKE